MNTFFALLTFAFTACVNAQPKPSFTPSPALPRPTEQAEAGYVVYIAGDVMTVTVNQRAFPGSAYLEVTFGGQYLGFFAVGQPIGLIKPAAPKELLIVPINEAGVKGESKSLMVP